MGGHLACTEIMGVRFSPGPFTLEVNMETVGLISRDEWLSRNPQMPEIQTLLERHDFVKFMDMPVVLDADNPVTSKQIFISSLKELLGMLETTSFSHIYQILMHEDGKFLVRGQYR